MGRMPWRLCGKWGIRSGMKKLVRRAGRVLLIVWGLWYDGEEV